MLSTRVNRRQATNARRVSLRGANCEDEAAFQFRQALGEVTRHRASRLREASAIQGLRRGRQLMLRFCDEAGFVVVPCPVW